MRISDWSSDVCSSDLIEDHRGIDRVTTPKLGLIYAPIHGLELKASWGKSFKVPTLFQTGQTTNAQLVPGFIFNPAPENANPVLLEIGRASCRERVCLYV